MNALVAGVLGLVAAVCMGADGPAYSFRKINGTESPDGRFALAWGFPKQQVDWSRYAREEGLFDAMGEEKADRGDGIPHNYLVDLGTGRVIREVGGEHFGDKPRYNHLTCQTFWSPDSKILIQLNAAKWSYTLCDAYWRDDHADFHGPLDLGAVLTEAGYTWLKQQANPAYVKRGKAFAASIEVEGVMNSALIAAHVTYDVISKSDPDFGLSCEVQVRVLLKKDRAGEIHATVQKVSGR